MIEIQKNISLKDHNTFGVDAKADLFAEVTHTDHIKFLLSYAGEKGMPVLLLGEGSNVLFTGDYKGLVIKNKLKGINIIHETEDHTEIEVSAGENWNTFVENCLNRQLYGIENLIGIPGCVGAAPIQNIGAYGVEQKDCFVMLKAYDRVSKTIRTFLKKDCKFGYRNSIFKEKHIDYIILSVKYRLSKVNKVKKDYGSVRNRLLKAGIYRPTPQDVAKVISLIRAEKLPDPDEYGNAGSFFKNPVISKDHYLHLKEKYPDIVSHQLDNMYYKIPAAWLIEQCGWKGRRDGNVGVYDKQALVLINFGRASGKEILELSRQIHRSVYDKFGMSLEREVTVI